jgi:hypothetical protein
VKRSLLCISKALFAPVSSFTYNLGPEGREFWSFAGIGEHKRKKLSKKTQAETNQPKKSTRKKCEEEFLCFSTD